MNVTALQPVGPSELVPTNTDPMIALIERAARDPSIPLDRMQQLMEMQRTARKENAERLFNAAMAAAKSEMPVILKNRRVYFKTAKGTTDYRFEDLAEIARTVTPVLAKHGLSYRYRVSSAINEPVMVTCIVAHEGGHAEETTLVAGRDDDQSNKNSIQRIGSTVTYLQRYTLKAALGLAASEDDDGAASDADSNEEVGSILPHQVEELRALLTQHKRPEAGLCKVFRIEELEQLPIAEFNKAKTLIQTPPRQS